MDEVAYSMRKDGATLQQIADTLGLSRQGASDLLARAIAVYRYQDMEVVGSIMSNFNNSSRYWKLELVHRGD